MTLQEKCDAWRERAEGLSNEMDQLKSLLDQLSRDKLAAEEQLAQNLKVHIQILMTITLNIFDSPFPWKQIRGQNWKRVQGRSRNCRVSG